MSPFLFWTIVWVGSRRYSKGRKTADFLAAHISEVALAALSARSTILQTLQGLLVLCTWPVPVTTMRNDLSYFLSGAALNLAMEIGLHAYGNGQDFSRVKLQHDDKQTAFRSSLWLHCSITCQRSDDIECHEKNLLTSCSRSIAEGLPPLTVFHFPNDDCESELMTRAASPEIRFRQQIQDIQSSAMTTMIRNGLTLHSTGQADLLSSLIEIMDTRVLEFKHPSQSLLNVLYVSCARLHIQSLYFFHAPDRPKKEGLAGLYSIAIMVIETVAALERSGTPIEYFSTVYIRRTLSLAALSILKLSRSCLAQHLDLVKGEAAYLSVVSMMRADSFQYNDLTARGTTIRSQLWNSQHVFRSPSGADNSLALRVRGRLSMSIVYDCFWYWREEFGGESSPFQAEEERMNVRAPASQSPKLGVGTIGDPGSNTSPAFAEGYAHPAPLAEPSWYSTEADTISTVMENGRMLEPGNTSMPNGLSEEDWLFLGVDFTLDPWGQL
ncbi:hypothetical protein LTR74_016983 [Friedmanniomyces endolithicus]|nr:hypothetical protein LTR74_016983 [Friedmanniomyces endolithicus]